MDEPKRPVLDPSQERALHSLRAQLDQRLEIIEQGEGAPRSGAQSRVHPDTDTPPVPSDASNVFGILGPRGSGKSTLLRELYARQTLPSFCLKGAILLPPLDCTTLPGKLPPGIAVLLHIRDRWLKDLERDRGAKSNHLVSGFDALLRDYSSMYPEYRELTLELSASFEDFGEYMSEGVARRLRLGEKVESWFAEAMLETGNTALIVPLDDFDLIPGADVRHWLAALLDELRRDRLMFVITADFHRLDRLSPDHEQQFDDKTGRALVHKLLPPRHRISLPRWTSVRAFGHAPVTLGDLLDKEAQRLGMPRRWLDQLIPKLARGVVNLRDALMEPRQRALSDRELLALLAECRDEPALARRLRSLEPADWVKEMAWRDGKLPVEDWEELVEVAQQRAAGRTTRPLAALIDVEDGSRRSGAMDSAPETPHQTARSPGRPDGGERADREQPRRRYLRDAEGQARPLWAETLADWCMAGNVRARARFLDLWGPARNRLGRARMRVDLDMGRMRHYFEDQALLADTGAGFDASLFSWLTWSRRDEPDANLGAGWLTLSIGWQPLLAALRGQRDGWPTEFVEVVALDPGGLAGGDVPGAGRDAALALLPSEIWAHVLLIDALDRCPWGPLRRTRGWELWTSLALAGVLVRSAYVYALQRIDVLDGNSLGEAQQLFIGVLERRNPVPLLKLQEHEMEDHMVEIFADDGDPSGLAARIRAESEKGRDAPGHALLAAAAAYLGSPVYTRLAACRPAGRGARG